MSSLKLNGHPVAGRAALQNGANGRKQLWAAITVSADSPSYGVARQAVLATSFEVTLEGEAHNSLTEVDFGFKAKGQLVNGRVGNDIRADFRSTEYVIVDLPDTPMPRPVK